MEKTLTEKAKKVEPWEKIEISATAPLCAIHSTNFRFPNFPSARFYIHLEQSSWTVHSIPAQFQVLFQILS